MTAPTAPAPRSAVLDGAARASLHAASVRPVIRTIAAGAGGAGGWQALDWAAEEAVPETVRLLVVRACPAGSPLARFPDEPPVDRLELADPPFAHAVAAVRRRLGGQRVTVRTPAGAPATALAGASRGADLLVLGAGGAGDTVRRVLRHAGCPVVIVHGLPGGRGATFAGHVVVGVDGNAGARRALEFAFGWADAHRLPLAAVHVSTGSASAHVDTAALDRLRHAVEPWVVRYPAVPVQRAVLRGTVVEGLVRAGCGAYLLVIGGHRSLLARAQGADRPLAIARNADCPVAVVPYEGPEGEPR
jgi:nucleotide-binding universal stress UspA family protein